MLAGAAIQITAGPPYNPLPAALPYKSLRGRHTNHCRAEMAVVGPAKIEIWDLRQQAWIEMFLVLEPNTPTAHLFVTLEQATAAGEGPQWFVWEGGSDLCGRAAVICVGGWR